MVRSPLVYFFFLLPIEFYPSTLLPFIKLPSLQIKPYFILALQSLPLQPINSLVFASFRSSLSIHHFSPITHLFPFHFSLFFLFFCFADELFVDRSTTCRRTVDRRRLNHFSSTFHPLPPPPFLFHPSPNLLHTSSSTSSCWGSSPRHKAHHQTKEKQESTH